MIALNNHRRAQELFYQQQLTERAKELESLTSELQTVTGLKAETEQELQKKAKLQADLEERIESLRRQLQAKKKRESLLAKAANAFSQPVYAEGGNLPSILIRIRACESGGDYTAQNPSSTASGAFQFLDSTWAGYKGYSRAMYAPPAIQDERAVMEYNANGTSPWMASQHCWA